MNERLYAFYRGVCDSLHCFVGVKGRMRRRDNVWHVEQSPRSRADFSVTPGTIDPTDQLSFLNKQRLILYHIQPRGEKLASV